MNSIVSLLVDAFAELLAPSACAACDVSVGRRQAFCAPCARSVDRAGRAHDGAAAFVYGGAIAVAVQRLKFDKRWDVSRPLGRVLAVSVPEFACDLIVPVPLCGRRLRERGFNQAALLAAHIADAWGVSRACDRLSRVRETRAQSLGSRAERALNLRGAFVARNVAGAIVTLVDDVRTTGATIDECTRALHAAGASRVHYIVLAQTP